MQRFRNHRAGRCTDVPRRVDVDLPPAKGTDMTDVLEVASGDRLPDEQPAGTRRSLARRLRRRPDRGRVDNATAMFAREASGAIWSPSPGISRPSRIPTGSATCSPRPSTPPGPQPSPPPSRPPGTAASSPYGSRSETATGRGTGLLRLTDEDGTDKAWTLLTALQELKGHEGPAAAAGPRAPNTASTRRARRGRSGARRRPRASG